MAEMYYSEAPKYVVLREAKEKGIPIRFDVMYEVEDEDRLGEAEGYYIRWYYPQLNKQVPKEEDYHKYINKPVPQSLEEVC